MCRMLIYRQIYRAVTVMLQHQQRQVEPSYDIGVSMSIIIV